MLADVTVVQCRQVIGSNNDAVNRSRGGQPILLNNSNPAAAVTAHVIRLNWLISADQIGIDQRDT